MLAHRTACTRAPARSADSAMIAPARVRYDTSRCGLRHRAGAVDVEVEIERDALAARAPSAVPHTRCTVVMPGTTSGLTQHRLQPVGLRRAGGRCPTAPAPRAADRSTRGPRRDGKRDQVGKRALAVVAHGDLVVRQRDAGCAQDLAVLVRGAAPARTPAGGAPSRAGSAPSRSQGPRRPRARTAPDPAPGGSRRPARPGPPRPARSTDPPAPDPTRVARAAERLQRLLLLEQVGEQERGETAGAVQPVARVAAHHPHAEQRVSLELIVLERRRPALRAPATTGARRCAGRAATAGPASSGASRRYTSAIAARPPAAGGR